MPRKKFPSGKICSVTNSNIQTAQSVVNKKHAEIEQSIDNLYDAEFGRIFDPGKLLDNSIDAKILNQRNHRATIARINATPKSKREAQWAEKKKDAQDNLKRATLDLLDLRKQKKELPKRQRLSKLLSELLKERLYKAALDSNYTLNVESVMSVLKGFLTERTGIPFVSLNNLKLQSLNLKYRTLKKWFDEQDKGIVPKQYRLRNVFTKGAVRGAYEWSMANPSKVVLYRDKSLAAIDLESKVLEILNKKSAAKIKYKDKYNLILQKLQAFVQSNNILYFPDPNNQPENPNKLSQKELYENERNVMELITDLMDGRTKYIAPQASKFIIQQKSIMDKYNKIITYANNGGWNISKDIHEVLVGDETFYYVTIKDTDKLTGQEVYKAYLAPHYVNSKNQTVFYYPMTKKGFRNGAWVKAINTAQNSKKDLPNVMVAGFRQAQTEKIFNGYNKDNKEINTKGYADYQLMDLKMSDPLFQSSVIRPGSATSYVMSTWKHIKDSREVLAEIFEEWQSLTKVALARIEESVKKFPQIEQALSKTNKTDEAISDTLAELKNLLNFNELIYLDKDNVVKSANITTGIKENYHPDMYEKETYRADLKKAINGMKDEALILEDKISQLKNKLLGETDPDNIRKIKASIISANTKIVNLVGKLDDDSKPGMIQIMETEFEQLMDRAEREDMPSMNTQSMISYAKHKKLFTNRLKDSSPLVLHGGRRKDARVIPDYIERVFDTAFNNELKSFVPEAISIMDPSMIDFMIEEVKAGIGRRDLAAGLPFFDYSDKNLLRYLRSIPGLSNLTEERLRQVSTNMNSMTSASLLSSPNVGLMNRMQGPTSSIVEIGTEAEAQTIHLLTNEPELVNEIFKKSGAGDTVQAVADIFLGGLESQIGFIDGLVSLKDIALLKGQNKLRFVNGTKGIRRYMISLLKRREGSEATYNSDQLDAVLGGVYDIIHGIAEGTLTEQDIKDLEVVLERVATKAQIRVFVSWGLNVFGLKTSVADLSGATQYLSMIEGEIEGRKIVVVRGVVYYADHVIGGKMAGDYLHPDAIEFARQLVNNTMFQFSQQYFSKIFRGALGSSLMKFKNYWVSQTIREVQIYSNFIKSLKGKTKAEILSEVSKIFYPSKDAYIPYAKQFGFDKDEVGGFNFKERGPFPYFRLTTDVGTDSPTEKLRQLMFTRNLMALLTVGSAHFFMVKKIIQFFNKKSPINFMSLGRGGESTTATLGLRIIQAFLGSMYLKDEEEEDENMQLIYRIFIPMYINVLADLIKSGDPFKVTRLWGSFFSDAAEGVYHLLSGEE